MSASPKLAEETRIPLRSEMPAQKNPAGPRRHMLTLVLAVVAVIVATGVYLSHRGKESTDDAFIESHVVTISPQISERVDRVLVSDNQLVKKGDFLSNSIRSTSR